MLSLIFNTAIGHISLPGLQPRSQSRSTSRVSPLDLAIPSCRTSSYHPSFMQRLPYRTHFQLPSGYPNRSLSSGGDSSLICNGAGRTCNRKICSLLISISHYSRICCLYLYFLHRLAFLFSLTFSVVFHRISLILFYFHFITSFFSIIYYILCIFCVIYIIYYILSY